MSKIFKCDFCGSEYAYEAQIRRVGRGGGLPGRPNFEEIYPDMDGKDICHDCNIATDRAFESTKPGLLEAVRKELDTRRVR